MKDKTICISVRGLVEYVLRSGSIDSRYISASRMQEGVRIHKLVQKRRAKLCLLDGSDYEKELSLSHSFSIEDFEFRIEGRADGVIRKDGRVTVEEIKSTMGALDDIELNDNHVHLAQAKCYAYFLCANESLAGADVMITYCHVETEKTNEFDFSYTYEELEAFFLDVSKRYFIWAKADYERKINRDLSIKASGFVFDKYRQGQREFSIMVYRAVENNENLFAQAPTGTGKTVSTLFPSVKAIGEGLADRIFYLTAKTITRQVAEEAVERMAAVGYDLLSVTLTAKDKSCPLETRICSPEYCSYADGHFDRVNDAVFDLLQNERVYKRDIIRKYAEKHRVCPHELTLDLSLWCDIVICDYNHVFDPNVRLKRFFGDEPKGDFILLIDEAHNLVDRSREMFSCELHKRDFLEAKKLFKATDVGLYKLCDKINNFFLEFRKTHLSDGDTAILREPPDFGILLFEFVERCDVYLARNAGAREEGFDKLLELYFSVIKYLAFLDFFSDRYRFYAEAKYSDLMFKLLCLDPSIQLRDVHTKAKSSVFFSATLTPGSYFKQVFGAAEYDPVFKLASPFPRENLCLIIENGVSTRYKDRGNTYKQVAESIYAMTVGKKGNYFAFFPSYLYLNEVMSVFREVHPDTEIIVQEQRLSDAGKEDFLQNFVEQGERTLIAFSVMGGVFSEGIDLSGERLIGVAVVGVGLPLISPERNLISEYYNERFEDYMGFDYAYVYPGINKVMQAAGRLIRTETDRGVVLLIDDRYSGEKYRSLFPNEWENAKYLNKPEMIKRAVEEFWG